MVVRGGSHRQDPALRFYGYRGVPAPAGGVELRGVHRAAGLVANPMDHRGRRFFFGVDCLLVLPIFLGSGDQCGHAGLDFLHFVFAGVKLFIIV